MSDYITLVIMRAMLFNLQVWKDVDGVLTCDPNIYPKAEPVPHLTFDEAAELAYFGAQVGPRYHVLYMPASWKACRLEIAGQILSFCSVFSISIFILV